MIEQARDILGLDLHAQLVYNNVNLLSTKFSMSNINLFGTKLMKILFTNEEMRHGTVEPTKQDANSLDQQKVDLIKSSLLIFNLKIWTFFFF